MESLCLTELEDQLAGGNSGPLTDSARCCGTGIE